MIALDLELLLAALALICWYALEPHPVLFLHRVELAFGLWRDAHTCYSALVAWRVAGILVHIAPRGTNSPRAGTRHHD